MTEKPKRLTPTPEVIRELYLKSGNECSYPSCPNRIMNEDGVFIAEMCHIEAALPGGPRFNPIQTNEERRDFSNLMLMCHAHHKITDDERTFPVERLHEIKEDHEARLTDVVATIQEAISDETQKKSPGYVSTLEKMNKDFEWNLNESEVAVCAQELNGFIDNFSRVPHRTRELLAIIVARGKSVGGLSGGWWALHDDIVEATHLSSAEVVKHVGILEHHGIGAGDEYNDMASIHIYDLESGWHIWQDLLKFAQQTNIPLRELLVDLRFDLLG